ncbi:hypothetical protein K2P97_04805 [bacterium]|nr:hypothetical protein [bacterium]
MILPKLHEKIRIFIKKLQQFSAQFWYGPLISVLAAADNFIVIVPTDGILISSSIFNPKKWFYYAFIVSVGSTLGAMGLAYVVGSHGLPWILETYPAIDQSRTWEITNQFFEKYGLLVVFVVAATPFIQQPAIILASLAHTPYMKLAIVIFVGRLLKYIIMSYIASHAPRLLNKMWGIQSELKDVGVDLK